MPMAPNTRRCKHTQFVVKILFTDEAGFKRVGTAKFYNTHVWVYEASRYQHRFPINVCVGILRDQFQGLIVFLNRLMDAVYHRFWGVILQQLLEHVPLLHRQNTWLLYFLRILRHNFKEIYAGQWVAPGGSV
jgi:hypothetical protein